MAFPTVAGEFDVSRVLSSEAYRSAFSRINGMVVVGEGMADRHFRLLAEMLPHDRSELLRLGAMEGRADRCGRGAAATGSPA